MAESLPPIKPTPATDQPETEMPHPKVVNELSMLGLFILENVAVEFDTHLGSLLVDAGEAHDIYAGNCRADHMYTDVPCDEYERGLALGIAWLMARIRQGAANGA